MRKGNAIGGSGKMRKGNAIGGSSRMRKGNAIGRRRFYMRKGNGVGSSSNVVPAVALLLLPMALPCDALMSELGHYHSHNK